MADLITLAQARPTDWAGDFVPGARATFFLSGTTTPAVVYQDEPGTIPFAQPVLADGEGVFPAIFSSVSLKAVVTYAAAVELPGSPVDPCIRSITTQGAASATGFVPTAEIPVDNVQSAIDRVQANLGARLAGAGVGVTQAPLLANIDDTAILSGRYRYDTSSAGVFPVGVVKADTGVIVISSGAVGNQLMELTPRDGGNRFYRVMVALTWSEWVSGQLTQAEAENPASTVFGQVSGQRLAQASSWKLLTATQAITNATLVNVAHSLGATIRDARVTLVCVTADAPYAVGDIIVNPSGMFYAGGSTVFGVQVTFDATNVQIRTGKDGNVYMSDVGNFITHTNDRWNYRVEVRASV